MDFTAAQSIEPQTYSGKKWTLLILFSITKAMK